MNVKDSSNTATGEIPNEHFPGILRIGSLIGVVIGAAGSVGLTLWFGRHNPSHTLQGLFAVWVLSPFVGMVFLELVLKRRPTITTLYGVMMVTSPVSLAVYFYFVFWPRESSPAAVFLVVPLASWLFITIAIPIAALISRKRTPLSPTGNEKP